MCEQTEGEGEGEGERERERVLSKLLFKITIELGLKNRNPLFPELGTRAVCCVVIRCACRCVRGGKGKGD